MKEHTKLYSVNLFTCEKMLIMMSLFSKFPYFLSDFPLSGSKMFETQNRMFHESVILLVINMWKRFYLIVPLIFGYQGVI
jgi:hypothetical protein